MNLHENGTLKNETCPKCHNTIDIIYVGEENICPICKGKFTPKVGFKCVSCDNYVMATKKEAKCSNCGKEYSWKERKICPNPDCDQEVWAKLGENTCKKCNKQFILKEGGVIEPYSSETHIDNNSGV